MDFYIKNKEGSLYVKNDKGEEKKVLSVWGAKSELNQPYWLDSTENQQWVDAEIMLARVVGVTTDLSGFLPELSNFTSSMTFSQLAPRVFPTSGRVWGLETATSGEQGRLIAGPFPFTESSYVITVSSQVQYRFKHKFKAPSDLWDNPNNYRFGCAMRSYVTSTTGFSFSITNLKTGQAVGLGTGAPTDNIIATHITAHFGFNLTNAGSAWSANVAKHSNIGQNSSITAGGFKEYRT